MKIEITGPEGDYHVLDWAIFSSSTVKVQEMTKY
jgi:hypothetical protein